MKKLQEFDIRLNIRFDSPKEDWIKIEEVYRSMPGFKEVDDYCDYCCWFGTENDEEYISVQVEPSGLDFRARMESKDWVKWLTLLCSRLSLKLGREVKDAES